MNTRQRTSALVRKLERIESGHQPNTQSTTPVRGRRQGVGTDSYNQVQQLETELATTIGVLGNMTETFKAVSDGLAQSIQQTAAEKQKAERVREEVVAERLERQRVQAELDESKSQAALMNERYEELQAQLDAALAEWTVEKAAWESERAKAFEENSELRAKVEALELAAGNEDPVALHDRAMAIMEADGTLNIAQATFGRNWLKKSRRPGAKTSALMHDLAILALIDFPHQTYDTFRIFLGLPSHRVARRFKASHEEYIMYKFGDNPGAWTLASKRFSSGVTVTTSDGTRIVRMVAALRLLGLCGKMYPADIRQWPEGLDPVMATFDDLLEYVQLLRETPCMLAHSLVTVASHSVTDRGAGFLPVMMFPEPSSGFGGYQHLMLMMESAKRAWGYKIHNTGDCTDSCALLVEFQQ